MKAREWAHVTGAPARWARAAARLGDGLEAVFDDAGRAGLAFAPRDAAAWRAFRRLAPALPASRPRFAWAFLDGAEAGTRSAEPEPWGRLLTASGGGTSRVHPGVAGSGLVELDAALAAFHGLHPLAGVGVGAGRLEARLAEPAPWPFFARCDLAKPFAARPAAWARRLGARGVAGFALAGGRMEVFVV